MMKSALVGATALAIAGTGVFMTSTNTTSNSTTTASLGAPSATARAMTAAQPAAASSPAAKPAATPAAKTAAASAAAPVVKQFSTNNVMGLPSMKVLGVTVTSKDGPFPGDGHGPVSACQQDRFAALGATSVATIRVWGTKGTSSGAVYQVAGQFRSVAAAKKAEATVVRWVAQCSAWSRKHILANPIPYGKTVLPAPPGVPAHITAWRLGGTDHEAGPINASIAVVRVNNRVTMYTNFYPQFFTGNGAIKLAQRAATVLAK